MIQEIYVYLLIRNSFINGTKEEMETWADSKEVFNNILKKIVAIMQMEDFFLISDTVMNNLDYFILYLNLNITKRQIVHLPA